MADLTANANIRLMNEPTTMKLHVDSAAARTIYTGQPIIADLDVDTAGLAVQYVDSVVVAATDVFLGIAAEPHTTVISDSETDEASWLTVWVEPTVVGFKSSVFDDADAGKTVYMSDSSVLSETAADNPEIGRLVRVLDGYAYVRLITPKICTGA